MGPSGSGKSIDADHRNLDTPDLKLGDSIRIGGTELFGLKRQRLTSSAANTSVSSSRRSTGPHHRGLNIDLLWALPVRSLTCGARLLVKTRFGT